MQLYRLMQEACLLLLILFAAATLQHDMRHLNDNVGNYFSDPWIPLHSTLFSLFIYGGILAIRRYLNNRIRS